MALNVRQKQAEVVLRVLNFNSATGKETSSESYKVLVLDRFTKDIVAPLLRLNDLRKHGVTLHLMLENERQPIPDVPAVYLVQPSPANIERITADAVAGLYDSMYLNFTVSVPGKLVEQLAGGVVKAGCLSRINKLYDQYLSFIALEPTLFSLGQPEVYVELNDPQARDYQIEATVGNVVDGLFSVCVTLGVVPIIRCPRGGAAEHIASALDSKLRDALKSRTNLFSESVLGLSASLSRPLLCLFDRNFDLSAAVQHAWTYKPLVQDVLGLKLNRIALQAEASGPGPAGMMAASAGAAVLDKHTNIATSLLGAIKMRALDQYFNTAEDLLVGKADLQAVLKLLQSGKGAPMDKLRLAIIYILAYDGLPSDHELSELENIMRTGGADVTALQYVRTLKRNNLTGSGGKGGGGAEAMGHHAGAPAASQTNLLDWADKTFGQGLSQVAKGVKTLLSGERGGAWARGCGGGGASGGWACTKRARQAPLAVCMEALMEGKAGTPEFDSYTVFDPKLPPGRASLERAKGPFRESIVFMIGGGNYYERETLLTWAGRCTPPRQVLYGATELLSGEEFVQQLSELGRRSGGR
ncbi:SEC1 family transport protein SLY1 [Tetrabaena socialis]|uniref:SEC1 family transport protein SLY1 n=1 Tax=Tetrabaena socialis TaxID=47790 RepID=A0A2J7ZX17_9CHLO|nr:SEC1 family transport protein SLY1 [Tetrabaena socialis]|eukprot:PNH04798.1 SEC1 family transport protein SLY1 [Tetrabaena socialis]